MKKTTRLLLLFTATALIGCATVATPINLNVGIPEGQGALFFASHSNFKESAMYEFYRLSGKGPSIVKTERLKSGVYQALLSMAPGKYVLKRAYLGPYTIDYYDGYMFEVVPDRVSYFGDVFLSQPAAGSMTMDVQDRQEEVERLIESVSAEFFNKYPVQFTLLK